MSNRETENIWKKSGTNYGGFVTFFLLLFIMLVGCTASIFNTIKKCKGSASWTDCYFGDDNYAENYGKIFTDALMKAKGGIIIGFVLITIIYQMLYGSIPAATTYLGVGNYRSRVIADAAITAGFGMLSTILLVVSRAGFDKIKNNWPTIVIVGLVLGSFNFVMESSGFNRYLARHEIEKGEGPYGELAGVKSESDKDITKLMEESGDPYIKSLSYTNMILISIFIVYLIGKMGVASYFGYRDKNAGNSYVDANIFGQKGTIGLFTAETVIVALLNTIPPIMAPFIRNEKYTAKSFIVAGIMFVVGVVFQIMLQYSGLLKFE